MMGAGKTTIGKILSKRLGVEFIDLDDEIAAFEGTSVAHIFLRKGESYFRKIEARILRELLDKNLQADFVMAVGGGTPCFFRNAQEMNGTGITIFIDSEIEVLGCRLSGDSSRPLLQDKNSEQYLAELLVQRRPLYETAKYTVKNNDKDINELVKEIMDIVL